MYEKIPTADMTNTEWLTLRKTGIGGSDAGAVCGLNHMKDNEYAVSDSYRVSWSSVRTTRLDTAGIKEEQPEIYRNYAKQTVSRRFQIKVA